jgi:hypothetical protein
MSLSEIAISAGQAAKIVQKLLKIGRQKAVNHPQASASALAKPLIRRSLSHEKLSRQQAPGI